MSRYGLSVLATVFLMATASVLFSQARESVAESEILVIAHRGASGYAPENTLAAFILAVEQGADVLEMDIRTTADDELIVIHDARVDRTTNGEGLISKMTLAEIKLLDAGYSYSTDGMSFPFRGQGITIPTLKEVFHAFPDSRLLLDIKDLGPTGAESLQRLIKETGSQDRVIIGCFDDGTMDRIRSLNPGLPLAAANRQVAAFFAASRLGLANWLAPGYRVLSIPPARGIIRLANPALVQAAQGLGVRVWIWTINDPEQVSYYSALGVDGIITDYPDLIREHLDKSRGK